MIKAGIVGGSGYTAGELVRLLLHHPETEIDFIYSSSRPGEPITSVHNDLIGETELAFSSEINPDVEVLFLCTGHGRSTAVLDKHTISGDTKIIDLSRDFRLNDSNSHGDRRFTYGLTELNRNDIRQAGNIANPGCFATAIQLALLPLAQVSALSDDVHIHGITGSTGAGGSLSETTHFSWRNNNVSIYKALDHQHIPEVRQQILQLSPSFEQKLNFIPVRGNFTRGIFISAYSATDLSLANAHKLYKQFYSDSPFVHLSTEPLHLKQAVNTNKCLIHLQKKDGQLLASSIIDNLLKGASGQAVQNMNLMFGLEEKTGLQLKPSHF